MQLSNNIKFMESWVTPVPGLTVKEFCCIQGREIGHSRSFIRESRIPSVVAIPHFVFFPNHTSVFKFGDSHFPDSSSSSYPVNVSRIPHRILAVPRTRKYISRLNKKIYIKRESRQEHDDW